MSFQPQLMILDLNQGKTYTLNSLVNLVTVNDNATKITNMPTIATSTNA